MENKLIGGVFLCRLSVDELRKLKLIINRDDRDRSKIKGPGVQISLESFADPGNTASAQNRELSRQHVPSNDNWREIKTSSPVTAGLFSLKRKHTIGEEDLQEIPTKAQRVQTAVEMRP